MKIPIASDHAGYTAKCVVLQILKDLRVDVDDLGTHSEDSVDYPEYAVQVAQKIDQGDAELGILICGQGVCMTANKYSGVRAALVQDAQTAALTRQHNNSNILCLPGRSLENEPEILKNILKSWLETPFEGGRHERRVQKISSLTSSHS
jgi:ribose 5-phosphate isomerase B